MKILILSNLASYTYNFRKELIRALRDASVDVVVAQHVDNAEKSKLLGCRVIEVPFNGKGKVLKEEIRLLKIYRTILEEERPDAVLSFTIKMNLYGGIECRLKKIPFFPMVTGLGEAARKSRLQPVLLSMYRYVMPWASCVFFQNEDDRAFFEKHRIKYRRHVVVPGSGVNLSEFGYSDYPKENPLSFAFIGRVTKAKGIDEYLIAAEKLRSRGYMFYVAGHLDDEYRDRIKALNKEKVVKYEGELSDVRYLLRKINCLVLPTWHPEGMSNVLLEAGAFGRPCICTNRTGCKEIITDGINGLFCAERDAENLQSVMEHFAEMSCEEKKAMGLAARANVEINFDRKVVVNSYLKVLDLEGRKQAVRQ